MNFLTDRKHVLVALAVLGDAMVFVLLVVLAPVEHGSVQIEAFGRTALPFAAVWLLASPWLGAFRISTLTRLRARRPGASRLSGSAAGSWPSCCAFG